MAGAALLYFVFCFGDYAFQILRYPIEWDAAEGLALFQLDHAGRGVSVYGDPEQEPLFIANYPPLYVWSGLAVSKLTGGGLLPLRLVSLAAALGTALLIGLGAWRAGARPVWALVSGLLFLSGPYAGWWLPLARVDSLALFLLVLAFFWADRRPMLSALALVAATYTRQTAVLGAVGVAIWYLQGRRFRELLLFSGVAIGVAGAALALLQWSSGGWFWHHVVTLNANRFYPTDAVRYLGGFLATMAGAALVTIGAAAARAPWLRREPLGLLIVPGLLNGLLSGKIGAAVNYFLPLQAALALTGALALSWLSDRFRATALPLALALASVLQMVLWGPFDGAFDGPPESNRAAIAELEARIEEQGGPFFLERHVSFALAAGQPVEYLPMPYKMLELSDSPIDVSAFHRDLESGRYAWLMVRRGTEGVGEFLDPGSQALIQSHYRPIGVWTIQDSDRTLKRYNIVVRQ